MHWTRRIFLWLAVALTLSALGGYGQSVAQAQPGAATAPRKLALLVGISKYQKGQASASGWWDLHAQNDVASLRQVLMERFGFATADILTLTDAQGTRQGIVNAFERHLIAQARPGDVVMFYFAGHGQLIPDDNGSAADGLDASLVPYDYKSQSAADGAKTNLRSDQVRDLLRRLQQKVQGASGNPGSVVCVLDTGFAGTSTGAQPPRGRLRERGRGWNDKLDGARPQASPNGKPRSAGGLLEQGEAAAQGYVVISAAADQPARETLDEQGRPVGLFTHSLTRSLNRAAPGTTYRDVLERMTVEMANVAHDQVPQVEGDAARPLNGGTILPPVAYVVVQAVSGNTVTLPVGALRGATTGSHYALFQPGTDVSASKNRVAEVEIVQVDPTSSKARLTDEYTGKVQVKSLASMWAVETSHDYGESRLKVWNQAKSPGLATELQDVNVATTDAVTGQNYDVLIRSTGGNVVVEAQDGSLLGQVADDAEAPAQVRRVLLGEWRRRFLSQLHNDLPNSNLKVELRLVPVRVETDERGNVQKVLGDRDDVRRTDGNRLILRKGDFVMLELRNTSKFNAYVTVLDMSPDGSIAPLYPRAKTMGVPDNVIPGDGQWHRIPMPNVFQMLEPYGNEIFKAIATRDPMDFSPLLSSKPPRPENTGQRGAPPNPIARLMLNASTGKRGASLAGASADDWATTQVTFEVQPQQ